MAALLLVLPLAGRARAADPTPQRIGVLATRGPEHCLTQWAPTAAYLGRRIPGHTFAIVPLTHDRVYAAVQTGSVDFILVNSAF